MKSSIFRRIFKSYLIIVLVVTVFLTLYNSTLIRRFYLQILTRDLTNIGYSLKPQVYPLIARHDVKALQALVRAVGQETDCGSPPSIKTALSWLIRMNSLL